ncbi:hypothetical protein EMIT079MI2_90112 [Bacillus sp. IT-79MI2]
MIEKHATNGNVITIAPSGVISMVGLVPHTSPQFTFVTTPFPGVITILRHILKQRLFVVHAISIPPFLINTICISQKEGTVYTDIKLRRFFNSFKNYYSA